MFICFSFLMWCAFCIFVPAYPYWIVYLAPFLTLLIFFDKSNINFMLMLDILANIGMIIVLINKYDWVYGGGDIFAYLLLKPYFIKVAGNVQSVAEIMGKVVPNFIFPMCYAVTVVSLGTIAYLSFKNMRNTDEEAASKISQVYFAFRVLILYLWLFICLALLFLA